MTFGTGDGDARTNKGGFTVSDREYETGPIPGDAGPFKGQAEGTYPSDGQERIVNALRARVTSFMRENDAAMRDALRRSIAERVEPDLLTLVPPPFVADWTPFAVDDTIDLLMVVTMALARRGVTEPWPLVHHLLAMRVAPMACYENALFIDTILRSRGGTFGHYGLLLQNGKFRGIGGASVRLGLTKLDDARLLETSEQVAAYARLWSWAFIKNGSPFQLIEDPALLPFSLPESLDVPIREIKVVKNTEPKDDDDKPDMWFVDGTSLHRGAFHASHTIVMADGYVHSALAEEDWHQRIADVPSALTTSWKMKGQIRYYTPQRPTYRFDKK
ncbi:MAG: hypothetical protein AAGF15_01190 [Pseudomonadota bacterium]